MAQHFDSRRAVKTAAIFLCGLFLALDASHANHWRRMGLISTNPTSRNVEYLFGIGLMVLSNWFGASRGGDEDDGPRNVTRVDLAT